MNELEIEQAIKDSGASAPRLTPEIIDGLIVGEDYYVFPGTTKTVCCLTLRNGFTVLGESSCVSIDNFNAEIGKKVAMEHARSQIWKLEGYALKERLWNTKMIP